VGGDQQRPVNGKKQTKKTERLIEVSILFHQTKGERERKLGPGGGTNETPALQTGEGGGGEDLPHCSTGAPIRKSGDIRISATTVGACSKKKQNTKKTDTKNQHKTKNTKVLREKRKRT